MSKIPPTSRITSLILSISINYIDKRKVVNSNLSKRNVTIFINRGLKEIWKFDLRDLGDVLLNISKSVNSVEIWKISNSQEVLASTCYFWCWAIQKLKDP